MAEASNVPLGLPAPCIVHTQSSVDTEGHFSVLTGVRDGNVILFDLSRSSKDDLDEVPIADFMKRWSGVAIQPAGTATVFVTESVLLLAILALLSAIAIIQLTSKRNMVFLKATTIATVMIFAGCEEQGDPGPNVPRIAASAAEG